MKTELHFEGTIAQHLSNGLVLAATGYAYQQLANDSGQGAENMQNALGAESLQARVFGVGPLIGYSTKVGDFNVSMKLKYIYEFGAKRRLESNVVWETSRSHSSNRIRLEHRRTLWQFCGA